MSSNDMFYEPDPRYHGSGKELVESHSQEDVIVIDDGTVKIDILAFEESKAKEIVLPDSLEKIEMHAFYNCENLHKVVFGNGFIQIGNDAFVDCKCINEIVFPEDSSLIANYIMSTEFTLSKYEQKDETFKSLEMLLDSTCTMCFTYNESAKKISEFLHSKIPAMTVKIVVGEKSIRIPKYASFIMDKYSTIAVLKTWIKTGTADKELFTLAGTKLSTIGSAMEMYVLDNDKDARKYLKEKFLWITKYLSQFPGNDAIIGYLDLGLLDRNELQQILTEDIVKENVMATAYILEQLNKKSAKKGLFGL